MPTLFLFQQGELIWKHVGIITKSSLEQVIKTKTVKPYLLNNRKGIGLISSMPFLLFFTSRSISSLFLLL
jgi:hypothetical protein